MIVTVDVDEAGFARLATGLGDAISSVLVDIASTEDEWRLGAEAALRHRSVDVLMNCAGIHQLGTS
jgi:hypothetical protein